MAQYFAGWDGGGTKTEVLITDAQGNEICRGVFGPLNVNGAGKEKVLSTVRDCVDFMAKQPGGLPACGGLCAGAAGVSNEDAAKLLTAAIRENGYAWKLRLAGDQEIALAGAVEGSGAVLIAGTGAICCGRNAETGAFTRVGGWGYLIDDGGSGYYIGREILSAAVRCHDGRGEETCLKEMALRAVGAETVGEMITWLYAPATGKKEIAALAPILQDALKQNDPAARQIAQGAAEELARLAAAAWENLQLTAGEIAFAGSILTHYDAIRHSVEERLTARCPGARIISPRGTPAQGAAKMARALEE